MMDREVLEEKAISRLVSLVAKEAAQRGVPVDDLLERVIDRMVADAIATLPAPLPDHNN